MAEQPQPAAARAFVEAEREAMALLGSGVWDMDGLNVRAPSREIVATFWHWADGRWVAHVRTSHAQALDLIRQQADEIERLRALVGELMEYLRGD